MAFIETAATARVAISGTLFGEQIVNTLWFTGSGNYGEGDLGDLCTQIASWWDVELSPHLSTDYDISEVRAYDMSSETGPVFSLGVSLSGGAAGASLPGQNAVTVTFRSANRGRSGRGRNYISGIREADVTGNTVSSSLRGSLATAYSNLNGYLPAVNASEHVVVSQYNNNAARSNGLSQPVISYVARLYIHVIRKRSSPQ